MIKRPLVQVLSSATSSLSSYRAYLKGSNYLHSQQLLASPFRTMATTIINPPRDPNTLANYNNWRTVHTTTTLDILFDEKKLKGNVLHTLKAITDGQSD